MAVLNVTGGSVAVVELREQWTAPAGTFLAAGQALYRHATTGYALPCGSADAASGIAINETTWAGQAVTAMRQGLLELGDAALQATAYEATIYVHGNAGTFVPGTLADAPTGGGTFPVGSVAPVFGGHNGLTGGTMTARKLLRVNL